MFPQHFKKFKDNDKLVKLLKNYHIHDYRNRPWNNEIQNKSLAYSTWLIHPSALSCLSIDFIFNFKDHLFTNTSSDLTLYCSQLKHFFTLSVICHMLTICHLNILPKADIPETAADAMDENDIQEHKITFIANKIMQCLNRCDIFNRLQCCSNMFDNGIKCHLLFNVILFKINNINFLPKTKNLNNFMNKFESFVDYYMSILEQNLNHMTPLTPQFIYSQTILSLSGTKLTCTDYDGQLYCIKSFYNDKFAMIKASDHSIIRTYVMNKIQDELAVKYAQKRVYQETIEKLTRTTVVVGSELSAEASQIIKGWNKVQLKNIESDKSQIPKADTPYIQPTMEKIEKEMEKFNEHIEPLQNIAEHYNNDEMDIGNSENRLALQSLKDLNLQISEITADKILQSTDKKRMLNASEQLKAILDFPMGLSCLKESIHELSNESNKNKNCNTHQILQIKRLKRNVEKLEEENISYHKCIPLLRDQLLRSMKENLSGQAKILDLKNTNKSLLKENNALHSRKIEERKKLEKYSKIITEMKKILDKVLTSVTLATEERDNLLYILKSSLYTNNIEESITLTNENEEVALNIIRDLLTNTLFQEKNKIRSTNNMLSDREITNLIEKSLFDLQVNVIPVFTGVSSEDDLNIKNSWLPYTYMIDKMVISEDSNYVKNKLDMLVRTDPEITKKHSEMTIIDMNPVSQETRNNLMRKLSLHSCNTELISELYIKRFYNARFPTTSNVKEVLEAHLKRDWYEIIKNVLKLSGEGYSKNGQKIGARIGLETLTFFIIPFLQEYLGNTISNSLAYIMSDFLDKCTITSTYEEKGGFPTVYEVIKHTLRQRFNQ